MNKSQFGVQNGWRGEASQGATNSTSSVSGRAGERVSVASSGISEIEAKVVDFETVRSDCLRRHVLYYDPDFPASDTALYYSRHPPYTFRWLRPPEIAANYGMRPELFSSGSSRFDLKQGELGDCWVVASAACMSENPSLLYRVLPTGQSFAPGWYAGCFRFQFWRYGKFEEVVIDDRLPTVKGRLVFIHSAAPNEFWGALLEKAYAKLHGSYEALKSGFIGDALQDMTGGLVESYLFNVPRASLPRNIINILFRALEKQSLIGAGIQPQNETQHEAILPNGLVAGHAYSITDLREIRLISDRGEVPVTLIRVRNPWGTRVEWKGRWSDRSAEWNSIPAYDRTAMGLVYRDDGEFWMDFDDFMANFNHLDICNLTPDCVLEAPRQWHVSIYHGRWKRGVSAGGRPVARETHWINPQIRVALKDTDDDEDELCSFVVELTQKDRRRLRHKGMKNIDMGFVIYKVTKDFTLPLPKRYFDQNSFVERCDFYSNMRSINKRFLMPPGDYVIMPSTYEPNVEADFMLRVFFEKQNNAEDAEFGREGVDPMPTPMDPQFEEQEKQFKQFFYDAAGEDMEINAFEFRRVLNIGLKKDPNHRDISIDACKSMMSLVDVDATGKLGYHEFAYLWNCIKAWKKTFYTHDKNNTGTIDSYELRSAIASHGYRLSSKIIGKLVFRYANEKYHIGVDSFIVCMAKILTLYNVFKSRQQNGKASFTLDEWLEQVSVI